MSRWLLVGLGNPGPEYHKTRHNVGFLVIDELARRWGAPLTRKRFAGRVGSGAVAGEPAVLLQPQTFMNLSGRSVGPAAGFYHIPPEQVVVVHDEIDLPLGTVRLKSGGGHGGHNGLRSVVTGLGSKTFLRVRVGVGRPEHGDVTSHVLGRTSATEQAEFERAADRAADAVEVLITAGLQTAMNRFHAPAKVVGDSAKGPDGAAKRRATP